MSKELYDIRMKLHRETEFGKKLFGAVFVSDDGDIDNAKWLPKSQIEMEPVPNMPGYFDITMPIWLAEEKELV